MQNSAFPFNQKQHIFDFKVKVNFENGNVSLTAPQIVSPPAFFNNQPNYNHNTQQSHNPITFSHNQVNNNFQNAQIPPNPVYVPPQYIPHQMNNTYQFGKGQQIQLVNSSYKSLKEGNEQSLMNNSMQIIQCVLCQKSFNANELQHHLQLHRNRVNNKNNISTQKNNVSNYAMTQNSVNGVNDSVLSDQKSNSSYQNQSYQSQNQSYQSQNQSYQSQNQSYQSQNSFNQSLQKNTLKNASFITSNIGGSTNTMNFITRRQEVQRKQIVQNMNNLQQNMNNLQLSNQSLQSNKQNESLPLLGKIQNPILALKAQQQQSSLSQSYSSYPNNQSLNYSNSEGQQSTTRFNNPIPSMNPHEQSPQFHNPQSNNSSFGNLPGSNVIGPSFYQNSSHQSGNVIPNNNSAPFFKGINRLAYNQSNASLEMQTPLITNPIPLQNGSFHSNQSNSINNSGYLSQNSNQFIQPHMNLINNGSQHFSHPSSNFSNLPNSIQSNHSSFGSNNSLHANFMPVSNNSNPIYHNFQTIESRYLNQPASSSRQLYGSYQEINNFQQSRNRNTMRRQEVPFSQSDISSISYQSRADLSQYSDWSDFHSKSQQKLQGYQSADNSIIKNMQYQQSRDKNNLHIKRRSKNENEKGEQNFFKKKKDYMISSAASYYQKKFKDDASSSSDQDNLYKTGRLSYAQRLKEKKMSDNLKSLQMSQAKSVNKLKNSHRSNKSNNLSKYSDDSNMSKTKLPVNYLARQEFISTSSTSKSTHKTSAPN